MVELTDVAIDAALERGANAREAEPRAAEAHYDRESGRLSDPLMTELVELCPELTVTVICEPDHRVILLLIHYKMTHVVPLASGTGTDTMIKVLCFLSHPLILTPELLSGKSPSC